MNIRITFEIEVNENDYKNLKKNEIRKIVKDVEANGSVIDYIESEIKGVIETENYNKSI